MRGGRDDRTGAGSEAADTAGTAGPSPDPLTRPAAFGAAGTGPDTSGPASSRPASSGPASSAPADAVAVRQPPPDGPGLLSRWYRSGWYRLAGAALGLAALAAVVLTVTSHQPATPARATAASCGLVKCSATLPVQPPASPSPKPSKKHHKHRRAQVPTAPAPVPAPTRTAAPPKPAVAVGFSAALGRSRHWHGWFQGQLTLANRSSADVSGWQLELTLPGDRVGWVSTSPFGRPPYPDASASGSSLTVRGSSGPEAIPAHGHLVLYVFVEGRNTSPSGCSFNGHGC